MIFARKILSPDFKGGGGKPPALFPIRLCPCPCPLSTFVDRLGDVASLTNHLTTPVKPAVAIFDDRHPLSPVTSPAAEYVAAAEIHRARVAQATAGTQGPHASITPAVVGGVLGIDQVLVGVWTARTQVGRVESLSVVVGHGDADCVVETRLQSVPHVDEDRQSPDAGPHGTRSRQSVTFARRANVPLRRLSTNIKHSVLSKLYAEKK